MSASSVLVPGSSHSHLDKELHGSPLIRLVGYQVEDEAQQGHHTQLEKRERERERVRVRGRERERERETPLEAILCALQ